MNIIKENSEKQYLKVSKIDPCDRNKKLPTIADRMDDYSLPIKIEVNRE